MNLSWSNLNSLQLGRYGEYLAKMEFTSYGYDVYTSEVDDHGVDFIAKDSKNNYFEIQVKSITKGNYTFIKKDKILLDKNHLVCYIVFEDGSYPDIYVFPATVWENNSSLIFKVRENEYGINYSKKNIGELEKFKIENFVKN